MWQSKGALIATPGSYKYPPFFKGTWEAAETFSLHSWRACGPNLPFSFFPLFFSPLFLLLHFIFLSLCYSICYCVSLTVFFLFFICPLISPHLPSSPWFTKPESLYLAWPPTSSHVSFSSSNSACVYPRTHTHARTHTQTCFCDLCVCSVFEWLFTSI